MKKLVTIILVLASSSLLAKVEALINGAWVEVDLCYTSQNVNADGSAIISVEVDGQIASGIATKCRESGVANPSLADVNQGFQPVLKPRINKKVVTNMKATRKDNK